MVVKRLCKNRVVVVDWLMFRLKYNLFCIFFQGKATGNKPALWIRSRIQSELFTLGCFIQRHAGKVVFVGLLILATFCVGLKSAQMEGRIEKLWVQGNIHSHLVRFFKQKGGIFVARLLLVYNPFQILFVLKTPTKKTSAF